jgi:hypothetical protein
MIDKMFPKQLNNDYSGHALARWVFVLLTIVTLIRSLIHMFTSDGGAQSIATIPLDSYSQGGAAAVVLIFSMWGLSQLLLGLLYVVVLWRYQAFIPFMYLLITIEYAGRIILGLIKPVETTGTTPGGIGNLIFVPLAIVMLILSLRQQEPQNKSSLSSTITKES